VRGHGANRELTQEEVDEMRKERDVFKVSEDGDGIEVLEKTT
jgi:predicted GNAT family acetyltransferase